MNNITIGEKYGMITVLEDAGRSSHGDVLYKCKCECGKIFVRKATIIRNNVKRGYVNSCGCNKYTHALAMRRQDTRQHMSEAAKKNADKTVERFKKLLDIADGTSYRRLENPSSRRDNKLGIKNICLINGTYYVQVKMADKRYRKGFNTLDEAIEYKKYIYETYINPAIESHKNNC